MSRRVTHVNEEYYAHLDAYLEAHPDATLREMSEEMRRQGNRLYFDADPSLDREMRAEEFPDLYLMHELAHMLGRLPHLPVGEQSVANLEIGMLAALDYLRGGLSPDRVEHWKEQRALYQKKYAEIDAPAYPDDARKLALKARAGQMHQRDNRIHTALGVYAGFKLAEALRAREMGEPPALGPGSCPKLRNVSLSISSDSLLGDLRYRDLHIPREELRAILAVTELGVEPKTFPEPMRTRLCAMQDALVALGLLYTPAQKAALAAPL